MKRASFVASPSAAGAWSTRSQNRGIAFAATSASIFGALMALLTFTMLKRYGPLSGALIISVASAVFALVAMNLTRMILRHFFRPLSTRSLFEPLEQAPFLVVPVIVRSDSDIEAIRANVDANIAFVARKPIVFLLDLPDAEAVVVPADQLLLSSLQEQMNDDISGGNVAVLTRRRLFDPVDRVWRGWERKRGKIEEFCRLLRSDQITSFEQALPNGLVGSVAFITIDIDTRLTPHTIGSLAAGVDREAAIVAPMLEDRCRAEATWFESLVARSSRRHAYDPNYNFNQSRLGYDLYYGKGLIVAERFLARTEGRIAERTILSHDHLESMLAGAVLSPEALIREEVPHSRALWARRQFRWIRGDFQLVPWIVRQRLPLISRLHLLEVVLGHLAPSCSIILALIVYATLPTPTSYGYALLFLAAARPSLLIFPLVMPMVMLGSGASESERLTKAASLFSSEVAAWMLCFIYAPGNLMLMLRAAVLVAWRLGWSGQKLLEWEGSHPPSYVNDLNRRTAGAKALAGFGSFGIAFLLDREIQFAAILISLWLLLPLILALPLPQISRGKMLLRSPKIHSQ